VAGILRGFQPRRRRTGDSNEDGFARQEKALCFMIAAPSIYYELREHVSEALGPCRSLLIGFDGRDGHGKTSAANWLAWEFGMPAISLDLFLRRSESPSAISWHTDDLVRCLESRERNAKPIIVEGVLLLDALAAIEKSPDFLVFVEKMEPPGIRDRSLDDDLIDAREFALSNQISRYFERRSPASCADFSGPYRVDFGQPAESCWEGRAADQRRQSRKVAVERGRQLRRPYLRFHRSVTCRAVKVADISGPDDLKTIGNAVDLHSPRSVVIRRSQRYAGLSATWAP
jgi:hypothetical protein